MKNIVAIILALYTIPFSAQLSIETEVNSEIEVCQEMEEAKILVINEGPTIETGVTMELSFPTGFFYVIGTASGATEVNTSDLTNPSFSMTDVEVGDTATVMVSYVAQVPSISAQETGEIFRINVNYNSDQASTNELTDPINILYPALNILSISPANQTGVSGQVVARTFEILNAGYGSADMLELHLSDNLEGLTATSVDLGLMSPDGSQISLVSTDFTAFGNGDGYFDSGEIITITQNVALSGCTAQTVSTSVNADWSCQGDTVTSVTSFSNISISLKQPSLNVNVTESITTCYNDLNDLNELSLTNNGDGYADNVVVTIQKTTEGGYNQNIYSAIETSTVRYAINNGTWIVPTLVETATRDDGDYSCLGPNPIGKVLFTINEGMQPGDVVKIEFEMIKCCINDCNNQGNMGWEYMVDYDDACNTQSYTKSDQPEEPTELNARVFTETPINIQDGETETFNFMISAHDNNLVSGTGAGYRAEFTVDPGLKFIEGVGGLKWISDNTLWEATNVSYNEVTGVISAYYPLPAPFTIEKSEFKLDLEGDCDNSPGQYQNIVFDFSYVPDTTCNTGCEIMLVCNETVNTYLHCPGINCEGFVNTLFEAKRISVGLPDNNLDGLPDDSGTLNEAEIRRNRVMYGDTLETTTVGHFVTGTQNAFFNNFYQETFIEAGSNLTVLSAEATIFDASTGQVTVCSDIEISEELSGNNKYFRFSLRPGFDCLALPGGFTFHDADIVNFEVQYVVSTNVGASVEEVDLLNDSFSSSLGEPWGADAANLASDKWKCNQYDARITLIGFTFLNSKGTNTTIKTCDKNISQNFYFSVGDCCDNYAGGNLFPYEYRNWSNVAKVKVTYPVEYLVNNVSFKQVRTVKTNQTSTQTINTITPYHNSGGTMFFNLSDLYTTNGGTIHPSDDGYHGTITMNLSPTCDVAINTFEDVVWDFTFDQSEFLGGTETEFLSSAADDRVRFTPTSVEISSTDPYQDGLGRKVTWDVQLSNASGSSEAGNVWFHLKTPSNELEIYEVLDADGNVMEMVGDVYHVGTIGTNQSKALKVVATYTTCAPDYIVAYAGYECAGYPDMFADFKCPYETYALHMEPKDAGMQVRISTNEVGENCSNVFEIEAEIASVKFGHLDSLKINVVGVGSPITSVFGTTQTKYNLTNDYVQGSEPSLVAGEYVYSIPQNVQAIEDDGLPGVTNFNNSRVRIKFQVELDEAREPGDYVKLSFNGMSICKFILPTKVLAFDPTIKLEANTTSGLTDQNNNTWGISWTDVNNDGADDAYISNYDSSSPNELFINNGDGTFTLDNNAILTAGNSVSSTFGDYDNDGDVDAFLSTNVGGPNELHRNNGDGTFTLVSSEVISEYSGYCHNATWVDADNDGFLDLFVTDYMPTKFNLLYKNNQNGTFTRITSGDLVTEARRSIGSTWADIDNDGDLDAFVPNTENQNNSLFINKGNFDFEKVNVGAIVTDGGKSVGSSWADYDNDGYLDLFVANTGDQADFLYRNNGDGTFEKITSGAIVNAVYNSSGSAWLDVDNDGDLDLFITADLGDQSILYVNNGDGTFVDGANDLTAKHGNSYPTAVSDIDNDGDIDILIGNRSGEKNALFTNERANCNGWLCVKLQGVNSNRDAIGAKIMVKATIYGESKWQTREVSSQTGGGAGSQNSIKQLFGLGNADKADSIVVMWPSGIVSRYGETNANNCLYLLEETGNKICGTVYYDENENCIQDEGEIAVPGIIVQNDGSSSLVITNDEGYYEYYTNEATITTSLDLDPKYSNNCQSSVTVDAALNSGNCNVNFGIVSDCEGANLKSSLGLSALRRGFTNHMLLNFENTGTSSAEDVTLTLEVSDDIILVSADVAWDSETHDNDVRTYTWDLGTVPAFMFGTIEIIDSVSVDSELDDDVIITNSILSTTNECDALDNSDTAFDKIVGSLDPNDKHVFSSNNNHEQVNSDDWLTYRIRFQNIGNYYATRLVIVDTLSQLLDLNTIEILDQSHDLAVSLEGNILTWSSNNTFLPDSASDLEGSQGYVRFKIRAKSNDDAKGWINNSAAIQFDFNEYLITNTVRKKLINKVDASNLSLIIYPNPSQGKSRMQVYSNVDDAFLAIDHVVIYDLLGSVITTVDATLPLSIIVDQPELADGSYMVAAHTIDGSVVGGNWIIKK